MDSVIVRADEHATERAESQIGVRMLEGDDAGVDDEERRGYGAVRQEDDPRDQGDQVRDVDERMSSKDRKDAHVLLGVVELMKAPHHAHAVIRQVREPVAPVHHHEDHADRQPARHETGPRQDDPRHRRAGDFGEGEGERRHERHDEGRVEHGVQEILSIATREERPALRGMHPFGDETDAEDHERDRSHDHHAKTCHGRSETRASPVTRPTNPDQDHGDRRD